MEQRLCYHWPIWFAQDQNDDLSQGQMVDLSSKGAAFTCYADDRCPYPGQYLTARFSIPQYGRDNSFDMVDFVRSGHVCRVDGVNNAKRQRLGKLDRDATQSVVDPIHVCRVDGVNNAQRRVAIQFAEPLPLRPGEQHADYEDELDEVEDFEAALV